MRIETNHKLPRLAWLLRIDANRVSAEVGCRVGEISGGFFEGGWSFCDDPSELRVEAFYLGSGAIVSKGAISIICQSHTCEAVYVARRGSTVVAGNSLAFVLSQGGLRSFSVQELAANLWTIKGGADEVSQTGAFGWRI